MPERYIKYFLKGHMNNINSKIKFIEELEKLKLIYRTNKTLDQNRFENSAEHSWHIAIMALILSENIDKLNFDLLKVIKMLLIHDIVEIDVGDINLYKKNIQTSYSDEKVAANRIFGLLPDDLKNEYISLWLEFEDKITNESKVANAIDNLQPLINHVNTRIKGDKVLDIKYSEIINKKGFIKDVSPELWEIALDYIEKGIKKGLYIDDRK